MKQLAIFVGVVALSLSVSVPRASADDHKYTLKDLKALIDQKGYQEVLQHLDDVAPSDRKQDWIDVAGQAAAAYMTEAEATDKLGIMVSLEKQYPALIKSAAYTKARLDAIPKAFSACYEHASGRYGGEEERLKGFDKCIEMGQKFIDSEPSNAAMPLAIARATGKTSFPYKSLGLFKTALAAAGKGAAAVCKEEGITHGVINALHFAGGKLLEETTAVSTTCWAVVKKPVMDEVTKKDTSDTFKMSACAIASAQKDYGKADAAACADVPKPKTK